MIFTSLTVCMSYALEIILRFSGEETKSFLTVGGMELLVTWNHVMGMKITAVAMIVTLWCSISTSTHQVRDGDIQQSVEKTIERKEMKLMVSMAEYGSLTKRKKFRHGRKFGLLKRWIRLLALGF
uniref:Uncharacterized protein n=1 Tax=Cannabis sativa TaxID=3483 RepID=A0A803R535_CANSA